jgi:amidohydrolase
LYLSELELKEIVSQAIQVRHQLHQIPEASLQEHKTTTFIREKLRKFELKVEPCTEVGTLVRFAQDQKGPHLAFRADIDGLPIEEKSELPYRSAHSGLMHACGHDGHSAVLFALALALKKIENKLTQPVTLIFQPGEEGAHGAKRLVEAGALKGITEIYGWHNWPDFPLGSAACPDGPVMAGNGTFTVILTGKGGHSSQPERNQDALLAASACHLALQQIVSRRLPPHASAVVAVTSIDGKSSETVQRETVALSGSIRLADEGLRETINQAIRSICEQTAKSYGVSAEVKIFPRYQSTVNHPDCAQAYRQALASEFKLLSKTEALLPVMASEDFSYYLNQIPGAFALIGSAESDRDNYSLHHERYNFNDKLIPLVLNLFLRRLFP